MRKKSKNRPTWDFQYELSKNMIGLKQEYVYKKYTVTLKI